MMKLVSRVLLLLVSIPFAVPLGLIVFLLNPFLGLFVKEKEDDN